MCFCHCCTDLYGLKIIIIITLPQASASKTLVRRKLTAPTAVLTHGPRRLERRAEGTLATLLHRQSCFPDFEKIGKLNKDGKLVEVDGRNKDGSVKE